MHVAQSIGLIALAAVLLWLATRWGGLRALSRRRFAEALIWVNHRTAKALYHRGYRYSLTASATQHCLVWRREGGLPHPVIAELDGIEVRRRAS